MEKETMTVEQVLQICIAQLNAIPVTVGMMDAVGTPIKNVVKNLTVCIEAMNTNKETQKDEREDDDE